MAAIGYDAIRTAVKTAIDADVDVAAITPTPNIRIEEELVFSPELTPYAVIYLDRRDAVDGDQRIAGGTRTDYILQFSLLVVGFSLDSLQAAVAQRDELLAAIEIALMRDRDLGGTVCQHWLNGGDFMTVREDESFTSIAELLVSARVIATV